MQGIDSDLIRGHIDTIILKVLFEGDRYGYEICKEVEEKSNGSYELKQPTLYSCLKRLESQGLISSYWEESEIGGKRHYYKLTEEGRKTFKENYDEWTRSRAIIDNLISNPYVKATSYTLVNKDEYENLEKKADLLDDETVQNAIKEAYEKGVKEGKENEPAGNDDKFLEAYNKGLADGKRELSEDIEKQKELNKQKQDEQSKLVESILSSSLSQEGEVIPWQVNEKEETLISNNDEFETFSWHDEDDAIVETTANGEPVQAIPNDEPALDQAFEFDNENLPFEENKAQASFFESNDEEFETEEKQEEVLPISYSEETPISYVAKPRIDSPNLKEDERNPFTFNMDSFLLKSSESYFESDDIDEPKADYIVPEMRIDGIEEKPQEEIKEEKKEEENNLPPSPVYHDFGADKIIKKPVEDEIWVDESEFDADSIYLNPDQAKDEKENEENDTLSLFDEDVKREEATPEEEDYSKSIFEEEENAGNSTFMDFYKSTDNYDNLNPTYTDEESKEKLSSLMNYSSVENKPEPENISRVKDYVELKNEFESEGLVVKVHRKHLKESKETRSYIESNKINLVTSWTSFGIITFLLTLVYFITNNYRANFNEALMNSVDTTYKYFLIGIAVILVVPVIYTILFLINPYKKKPARYAFRIYMLFAILLTVQLCIITYCVNLQLGFYSFSQPTYNHLLWIVPVIMSLYPIVDALVHNIYFKSKNFHV